MHHDVSSDIPIRRYEGFPKRLLIAAGGAALLGLLLWAMTLMGDDSARAWQAYLHAWLFFASLAVGAIAFACALVVAGARWPRSIRRFALSPAPFLPIAWLLLIPILLQTRKLFPWAQHPET